MGGFITQDIGQALVNTIAICAGGVVAVAGLLLLGWAIDRLER